MNAGLLHTIARRDRAAEAAARCGVLARQAGLRTYEQCALNKKNRTLGSHLPASFDAVVCKRPVTLTYRCGGSAGLGVSTSPASRFTRGVNRRAPDAMRL